MKINRNWTLENEELMYLFYFSNGCFCKNICFTSNFYNNFLIHHPIYKGGVHKIKIQIKRAFSDTQRVSKGNDIYLLVIFHCKHFQTSFKKSILKSHVILLDDLSHLLSLAFTLNIFQTFF